VRALFFFGHRQNFFDRQISSQFGYNVRKGRRVHTVTTSFNTITGQMAEMSAKKTGACSSSSRNYDLTMQFCNTSLRQRGQRSIGSLRGSTKRLNKPRYSAVSSNAETSVKYQISTAWWNEYNRLYAIMTIFAQRFNICRKFEREFGAYSTPLWI